MVSRILKTTDENEKDKETPNKEVDPLNFDEDSEDEEESIECYD